MAVLPSGIALCIPESRLKKYQTTQQTLTNCLRCQLPEKAHFVPPTEQEEYFLRKNIGLTNDFSEDMLIRKLLKLILISSPKSFPVLGSE